MARSDGSEAGLGLNKYFKYCDEDVIMKHIAVITLRPLHPTYARDRINMGDVRLYDQLIINIWTSG